MDFNRINILGFTISRNAADKPTSNTVVKPSVLPSFSPPENSDGALTVSAASFWGTYIDLDGSAKNEIELITRYREMSMQPEVQAAIDNVVNEAIVQDKDGKTIEIVMDKLDLDQKIKDAIKTEFDTVQKLLNYNNMAQDLFRRWYVDGRMFYNIIIDKENPSNGILELRYIDPRKIRKIRELRKVKDQKTGAEIYQVANEYYIYNEKTATQGQTGQSSLPGIRITTDSVINVNSGLMDSRRVLVLSYLHPAIKPLNQLRMIEDASVIYRISRAPERRIFYIDCGNLPKAKAEQYLYDMQTKYKNKIVYDVNTGQVRDDRRFLSMLEDFWIPRWGGQNTAQIDTLSGGENLGVIEDIIYFEKKLYKSLNVPVSRLNPQEGFSLGRSSEITRDELLFQKFIERLRNKFTAIFDQALRIQLVLKGICTTEEWEQFKEFIYYDFVKDNAFTELKNAELMQNRLSLLGLITPYTGIYYSKDWIRRNVLQLNDDEIRELNAEMKKEQKEIEADETLANKLQQAGIPTGLAPPMEGEGGMNGAGPSGGVGQSTGNPDNDLNLKLNQLK